MGYIWHFRVFACTVQPGKSHIGTSRLSDWDCGVEVQVFAVTVAGLLLGLERSGVLTKDRRAAFIRLWQAHIQRCEQ